MFRTVFAVVLFAVFVNPVAAAEFPVLSYQDAYDAAQVNNKPLVVMIGASWCGPCQGMKHKVFPELARRGIMGKVNFAYVDSDREPATVQSIGKGTAIPQLIVYRKSGGVWSRTMHVGAMSANATQAFILGQ